MLSFYHLLMVYLTDKFDNKNHFIKLVNTDLKNQNVEREYTTIIKSLRKGINPVDIDRKYTELYHHLS